MLASQLHPFRPRLLDTLRGYTRERFVADASAGVTVAIVALPLAMAFAIASGLRPSQGIFTAIVAGFIISAFGGSNVQIGGPAGAFIVIVYGILQRYGLTNLLIATALAGVVLWCLGWFRLGGLVRYIPVPIVIGFTNGIAVLIALSQVHDLLGVRIDKLPADFFSQIYAYATHIHTLNPSALGLGVACVVGLFVWQALFTRGRFLPDAFLDRLAMRTAARMPGPIVALVTLTVAAALLQLPVETIGTRFGGIPQGLPELSLPPLRWESAQQLFIPTLTIALLSAVESLLCARVADNLTDLPRHDPNQELMALGLANIASPLVGGLPATGTIARTVTNVRSGATTPVSGIVHAVTLLVIVLVAAPLAAYVPLAVLSGILLYMAWNMGEWHEFRRLRRFSFAYRSILLGTFALTVIVDLTVAVQVGLVMACIFFIYRMSTLFRAEPLPMDASAPAGVKVYRLFGSLFFGAVTRLEAVAQPLAPETRAVVLEMHRLISIDTSGLEALEQVHRTLERAGVRLLLCALNEQPLGLIRRSGFGAALGEENLAPDLATALQRLTPPPAADGDSEDSAAGPAAGAP